MTVFFAAILLGFSGSIHCLGMCGPLVMSMKFGSKNKHRTVVYSFTYHLGRILTYVVLGLIVGIFGWAVSLFNYNHILSITIGVILIFAGLISFTRLMRKPVISYKFFTRNIHKIKSLPRPLALFCMGMLNGLLPCGLVYIAIGTSVVMASPFFSALFMLGFGIGTSPLLMLMSGLQNLISKHFYQSRLSRYNWKAVLSFIAGVLLIIRGLSLEIPNLSPSKEITPAGTAEYFCH